MIVKEPSIDQYLVATCLSIIDEFNILYRGYNHNQLKKEADEKFNEMDITVRVGYPFKQTAIKPTYYKSSLTFISRIYFVHKPIKILLKDAPVFADGSSIRRTYPIF